MCLYGCLLHCQALRRLRRCSGPIRSAELAGVRAWEKTWAGKKIDQNNVDQVAQFLPDALVGIIKNPEQWGAPAEGYYFMIRPYEFVPETPGFIAASQANAGKAQLAPDGTIANI